MPDPITSNHTCGLSCAGDRHCTEVLAIPTCTAADILQGANHYLHPHGWQAVEARRVFGVDVEAWRTWMQDAGWGTDLEGRTMQAGQVPEGAVVGWLMWIEPLEEAHAETDRS